MTLIEELVEKLDELKVAHDTHEDPWYSCPKSARGCANPSVTDCNCGAGERDAKIDSLIAWARQHIEKLEAAAE